MEAFIYFYKANVLPHKLDLLLAWDSVKLQQNLPPWDTPSILPYFPGPPWYLDPAVGPSNLAPRSPP